MPIGPDYNKPSAQMPDLASPNHESFIVRWQKSSASERANYALFLSELCDYLGLPRPQPSQADESLNIYVIDKAVVYQELDGSTTTNYIDLYKKNCFVLEAKQGSNPIQEALFELAAPEPKRKMKRGLAVCGTKVWDTAMLAAREQAERYAKALPASEGWPPFLIVAEVGYSIELFADFSLTGKAYLPFPGPHNSRILFEELEKPEIRERLCGVWLDPHALDPSKERAKVTREVASKLATIGAQSKWTTCGESAICPVRTDEGVPRVPLPPSVNLQLSAAILQKITHSCDGSIRARPPGSLCIHGQSIYFANPRQHLCQFSQLFHVEQFCRRC